MIIGIGDWTFLFQLGRVELLAYFFFTWKTLSIIITIIILPNHVCDSVLKYLNKGLQQLMVTMSWCEEVDQREVHIQCIVILII